MLHITPLTDTDAPEVTQKLFSQIRQELGVDKTPLMFQYAANFERYFQYMWQQLSSNLATSQVTDMVKELQTYAAMTVDIIYSPSAETRQLVESFSSVEKHNILITAHMLERVNCTLSLLGVAIRESIKGFSLPSHLIEESSDAHVHTYFSDLVPDAIQESHDERELALIETFLIPLFGEQGLSIIRYPEFFTSINHDMDTLLNTEAYLKTRVELEHMCLLYTSLLPHPLALSYRHVAPLIEGEAYFFELVHLLKHIFPSTFPRLFLTSSVMLKALKSELVQS